MTTTERTLTAPRYELVPDDGEFEVDGSDYLPAEDLELLAIRLIAEREQLKFAGTFRVLYRWRRNAPVSRGNATLGACAKTTGLLAHFAEADYIVWLAADAAREYKLSAHQVEALLFHELLHIIPNSEGAPAIRAHDWEGFAAEIEVYGLWLADVRRIGDAVQLSLGLPGLEGA